MYTLCRTTYQDSTYQRTREKSDRCPAFSRAKATPSWLTPDRSEPQESHKTSVWDTYDKQNRCAYRPSFIAKLLADATLGLNSFSQCDVRLDQSLGQNNLQAKIAFKVIIFTFSPVALFTRFPQPSRVQLLTRLGTNADDEKQRFACEALVSLKLELRSFYSSLAAISGNEISATQLRSMEGIRHLLASFSDRTRVLEEEIGDPVMLAKHIVANNVEARVSECFQRR